MTAPADTLVDDSQRVDSPRESNLPAVLAVLLGVVITFAIQGYQFGKSNHTVYLLDAMHRAWPEVLAKDWYTTQTLQYHPLFGLMTRSLLRAGIIEPAFLIGHILVVA